VKGLALAGACPECKWGRDYGCRFDCPLHQPPEHPDDYRRWADEQKEGYAEIARDVASKLAEERREANWRLRHPDVPYGDRYEYWKHLLSVREGAEVDARQSA
jgi:hypothetical protein